MKSIISTIISFVFVTGFVFPVLAQSTPPPARDGMMQNRMDQRRENMEQRMDERKEAVQKRMTRLLENRKNNIRNYFGRMIKRFEEAVKRLKNLADRIESRLNKFTELGKDVSASRISLGEAKRKIADAETAIAEAKSKLDDVLNSDSPKEAFKEVRVLVVKARDAIKDAHQALVKVIKEIKGASGRIKTETTTPEANQ